MLRVDAIRRKIASMNLVCSGTLVERWKTCGKPNCRCATDPKARHGPYHEWGRMAGGKLVHRTINPDDVKELQEAISNHREILRLLDTWERETISILLGDENRKPN